MKVVVVGASGKLGGLLVSGLSRRGIPVFGISKYSPSSQLQGLQGVELVKVEDYQMADWSSLLGKASHLVWAGGTASSHLVTREVFERETEIAHAAAKAVQAMARPPRVILISSIHAGKGNLPRTEYTYPALKAELEKIWSSHQTGPDDRLTIFQAGSVFGRDVEGRLFGVPAQFCRLAQWPILFPVSRSPTRKHLLFAENLVSAVSHVIESGKKISGEFSLVDGNRISTGDMLDRIKASCNGTILLVPVPGSFLGVIQNLLAKTAPSSLPARLVDWLCREDQPVENNLADCCAWEPIFDSAAGLTQVLQTRP